jgi:predicted dehydrogenase
MSLGHRVTLLGSGLIGMFYVRSIRGKRGVDQVLNVYSRTPERAREFALEWDIPRWSSDLEEAVNDPETDTVVIGTPNHRHLECVELAAGAGKAILCTKPLARNGIEAKRILDIAEKAGVFSGYLEDLVYPPKTLHALRAVSNGAVGRVTWVRSRETHGGPHSAWFWDRNQAGGGAILDLGCHCVEIGRSFIGKDIKPIEAICWADTLVHPIPAEDNAVALVRYANGAIGQFEVSWSFRGGMDLRDEVQGTEGTIWLNHFLRTGYEMFTGGGTGVYVAEKAEVESGWLFPVGDEDYELGNDEMFADMFRAMDEGRAPTETFYDGYVVNSVLDACYKSIETRKWEPILLEDWRGKPPEETLRISGRRETLDGLNVVKRERMTDGSTKIILQDPSTGEITQRVEKG